MKKIIRVIVSAALMLSFAVIPAAAQSGSDASAWRALAERLDAGAAIEMRLRDGRHFKATFIEARPEALLVQRRTRIPMKVESIDYESIASLSRVQSSNLSPGKVAGIALGSAGAAVGVLWLIALATLDCRHDR
jgi:hypothetical protein